MPATHFSSFRLSQVSGVVFEIRLHPGRFFQNALIMGERPEAGLAMVVPDAAFTDAPERKTVVGKVHDRIIDTSPTEGNFAQDLFLGLLVFGK